LKSLGAFRGNLIARLAYNGSQYLVEQSVYLVTSESACYGAITGASGIAPLVEKPEVLYIL
jgi:hypothetical protein